MFNLPTMASVTEIGRIRTPDLDGEASSADWKYKGR